MTDIDLNFLARQLERILAEQEHMQRDIVALIALVERITERTEDEVRKLREFRMSDLPDA
jgi:hypothetical protein